MIRAIVLAALLPSLALSRAASAECVCQHRPGLECQPSDDVICPYRVLIAMHSDIVTAEAAVEAEQAHRQRAETETTACRATLATVEAQPSGPPWWTLPVVGVVGLIAGLLLGR